MNSQESSHARAAALSVGGSGSKLDPGSSMRSLRGPVNWDDARISENVARIPAFENVSRFGCGTRMATESEARDPHAQHPRRRVRWRRTSCGANTGGSLCSK